MDDSVRVNGYVELYKQQMEHYHKKQEMEARGSFGVWTLLGASIYLTVEKSLKLPLCLAVPALVVLLALHFYWLWSLMISEGHDRTLWNNYRHKADNLLDGVPSTEAPRSGERPTWILLEAGITLALSILLVYFLARNDRATVHADPLAATKWRFVVSGDSRNCGDVIMPTIAAQSAAYAPEFYWHLGDLRAIFKIDEDMADAVTKAGQKPECKTYLPRAWDDFVDNQIAPFGKTPFYLGVGNHETIPPENEDKFVARFADWLSTPVLQKQRLDDGDEDPRLPKPYYHWIQGGVDFIYLDNASSLFSPAQLNWFDDVLAKAKARANVRSVVVGMHEALPGSIAKDHGMCDKDSKPGSCESGKHVYDALLDFQRSKPVYVLASHSHFYMERIFSNLPASQQLAGWIVGTAGAHRYVLPPDAPKDVLNTAKEHTYGFLVGTVNPTGRIDFEFQKVEESDVPEAISRRYNQNFVSWCFKENAQKTYGEKEEPNPRCTQ